MIFLNLLNKIFGPKENLTRQEIKEYKDQSGDLHQVELKAAGSKFDADALAGWENSPLTVDQGMEAMDKKMGKFLNTTSKINTRKSTIWSISLLSACILVLVLFIYQGNKNLTDQISPLPELAEQKSSSSEEIDLYDQIPEEKQITRKDFKEATRIISSAEEVAPIITPDHIEQETIHSKRSSHTTEVEAEERLELPVQSDGNIPNPSPNALVYNQAKEFYINDLKNVDYRVYRDRPLKTTSFDLGTPADQEVQNFQNKSLAKEVTAPKEITYIEYLSETAGEFNKGEFKTALKRYLVILNNYPDDVNANFYGGLCYFNLGQFEQSIQLFDKSYTIGYGNFREEAMWFTARANYELENNIKTRGLLKKIIKEDGFYKTQAQELLIKLK